MLSTRPAEERATMLLALDLTTSCLKFPSSLGFPRAPTTLLNLQNACNHTFQEICNKIQRLQPISEDLPTQFKRLQEMEKNTKQNKTKPKLRSN